MQKGAILSIDDDKNLQEVVGHYLEDDGYTFVAAYDIAGAMEKIDALHFDTILLDLILPDGEGMSIIPQLRAKTNAAIIVVSGKSDTTEKIICLEMGADDYMTKPFEMRELSARIKAILRRANDNTESPQATQKEAQRMIFNGWCLDRSQYQLFDKDDKAANLTTGEFKLLEALVRASNRTLTREQLFEITRNGEFDSYDRAIDIQIARLRKKLKRDSGLIKTVRGVGYMFTGKIEAA